MPLTASANTAPTEAAHPSADLEARSPLSEMEGPLVRLAKKVKVLRVYFGTYIGHARLGPVHLAAGYSPIGWGHEETSSYARDLFSISLLSDGKRNVGVRFIALFINFAIFVPPRAEEEPNG